MHIKTLMVIKLILLSKGIPPTKDCVLYDFIYIKYQKMHQWLPGGWIGDTHVGKIPTRHKETFERIGYIHYLNCGDSFTGICIFQNVSNCTHLIVKLIICHLYLRETLNHCLISNQGDKIEKSSCAVFPA